MHLAKFHLHILLFIGAMILIKAIPFDAGLNFFMDVPGLINTLDSIFKDGLILIIAWLLIFKFQLHQLLNLFQWKPRKSYWLFLLPLYFIPIFWITNNPFSGDLVINNFEFFSTLLQDLVTGLEEEFAFRGVIFGLVIYNFKDYRNKLLRIMLITSSLFGIIHLLALFNGFHQWPAVLAQVISAFMLSFLFCSLLLHTGNIVLLGLVHGLLNFSSGLGDLLHSGTGSSASQEMEGMLIEGIVRIIVSLPCLLIGIYLLKSLPACGENTAKVEN